MSRRSYLSLAALFATITGAAMLFSFEWRSGGNAVTGENSGAEFRSGPEIALLNMEMLEIRDGGAPYRLISERASYRILDEDVSATGVTLLLKSQRGEAVVRAPEARWDLKTGRIVLPAGGSAEDRAGWTAHVESAHISIAERVLNATGKATLSGPGLTVAGENLVWHWQDGKLELDRPSTRVIPARVLPRKG